VHATESSQVDPRTPAESAPPADIAPPPHLHPTPAESAPGTVREPSVEEEVATSSSSATRKRATRRTPKGVVAPRFDDFWGVYPKRKDRGDAEAAWTKAINDLHADAQAVIDAALVYAMQRKGQDPQWTKLPATWLNKRCWLDEPDPAYNPGPPVMIPGFPAAPKRSTDYSAWRNPTDPNAYEGAL